MLVSKTGLWLRAGDGAEEAYGRKGGACWSTGLLVLEDGARFGWSNTSDDTSSRAPPIWKGKACSATYEAPGSALPRPSLVGDGHLERV